VQPHATIVAKQPSFQIARSHASLSISFRYLRRITLDHVLTITGRAQAPDFSRGENQYASRLFRQGKAVAGRKPLTLITDGLHAYHLAYKREFYAHQKPVTRHVEHITWQRDGADDRKMERFNGEVRDR
jgi:hypothetical protein